MREPAVPPVRSGREFEREREREILRAGIIGRALLMPFERKRAARITVHRGRRKFRTVDGADE